MASDGDQSVKKLGDEGGDNAVGLPLDDMVEIEEEERKRGSLEGTEVARPF